MQDPAFLFQISNFVAMAGWLVLLLSPFMPRIAQLVSGLGIPVVLGLLYTALILVYWSRAQGGFDSLDNVAKLFTSRELLLAGWIHYLAFDLFVGATIVRTARAEQMPFLFVLPCLPLTFLFGPAGLVAFWAIRLARQTAFPAASANAIPEKQA